MQNDLVPIIQKLNDSPENTSKIIKLIWLPKCNATVAWEKARNIGRKDKLNRSENMDRYYKSSHQNSKHLRQDKQYLKENNLIDSQTGRKVKNQAPIGA
ncbi:hypothetical protein RirG_207070 [Rhizophagus irregularis DAOM 197198w]|uniref:Uncharacterized protein n=1 Tax=Rhizophagus irregularis (strain DAOM 197198w) TaxID=1432141 RepID=A0A015IJW1_RHIIW|nr:hypothetical protein RirG_207070 [Rhizophagus irregularis DAOM 197198w]